MGPLWVEEGMRQFRLGVALQRLISYLGKQPWREAYTLKTRASKVLDDFTSSQWIPGIRDAVARIAKQPMPTGDPYDPPSENFGILRERLLRAFPSGRGEAKNLLEVQKEVCQFLWTAVDVIWGDQGARSGSAAEGLLEDVAEMLPAVPLIVARRDAVRWWLRQAIGLAGWYKLRDALQREENSHGELQRTAEELRYLEETLERSRETAEKRWSLLNGPRWYCDQVLQSLDQVESCRKRIKVLLDRAPRWIESEQRKTQRSVVEAIENELQQTPADWPPKVLANLQQSLDNLDSDRFRDFLERTRNFDARCREHRWEELWGDTELCAEEQSRCILVFMMVRSLADMRTKGRLSQQAEDEAWPKLREATQDLLQASGTDMEVIQHPFERGGRVPEERRPRGEPIRRLRTGIGLRWPEGKCTHLLRSKFEFPAPSSGVAAPLERLLRALGELAVQAVRNDGAFGELCRHFWGEIQKCESVGDWLGKAGGDRESKAKLVWRIVQRVCAFATRDSEEVRALAATVLTEFNEEGVEVIAPARPSEEWFEAKGPTLMSTQPAGKSDAPLQYWGLGVKMPGFPEFLPSAWLAVPESWISEQRPLVRCLYENQLLLEELAVLEPDWDWETFNGLVRHLVFGFDRNLVKTTEAKVGKEICKGILDYANDRRNQHPEPFKEFAQHLLRCLEHMGEQLTIPLDPSTLKRKPLKTLPDDGTIVTWAESKHVEYRVPISCTPTGEAGEPARMVISLGRSRSETEPLIPWLRVPDPDFLDESQPSEHPLVEWYRSFPQVPWNLEKAPEKIDEACQGFRSWVRTPTGRLWLDRFLHDVWKPSLEHVLTLRHWYKVLTEQRWLESYPCLQQGPELDSDMAVEWPKGVSTRTSGVCWTSHPWESTTHVAPRRLVGNDVVFSPDPEHAEGTFSLGRLEPDGLLDFAVRLEKQIDEWSPPIVEKFERPVRHLVSLAREREVLDLATDLDSVEDTIKEVLDRLVEVSASLASEAEVPNDDLRQSLDAVFGDVRNVALGFHVHIVPFQWSFVTSQTPEEVGLSDEQVKRPADFCSHVSRGELHLLRFGVEGRAVRRPRAAELEWSAGEAPAHFYRLRDQLGTLGGEDVGDLLNLLRSWPEAALDDMLRFKGRDFITAFWDRCGDQSSAHDAEASLLHETRKLLDDLLRDVGLKIFEGGNLRDYGKKWSSWLEFAEKPNLSQAKSRNLRTLRPGICSDDRKRCYLRALVQLE